MIRVTRGSSFNAQSHSFMDDRILHVFAGPLVQVHESAGVHEEAVQAITRAQDIQRSLLDR